MSKSVKRVEAAAKAHGLPIEVLRMPQSTRTAEEAAAACGCNVAQIVKSMIFRGEASGALKLLLVSGAHTVDLQKAAAIVGEPLARADAQAVREETGFAIGGVAPIGHKAPIAAWIDETLLTYPTVWAAAGAPDAVFKIAPAMLQEMAGAETAALA